MYCINCGTQISESASFCPACCNGIDQTSQSAPPTANLRGFSTRIGDPAFAKYVKNSNRWASIFSIILAVAAVVGFYIAGEMGVEDMKREGFIYEQILQKLWFAAKSRS